MGFFGKMREAVFGKPMETSEERIARAEAENARQTEAIRKRMERGEVEDADAAWRAAEKGHGDVLRTEMGQRAEEDAEGAAAATEEAQKEAAA